MGIEDLSITSDLKNLAEKLPKEHRAELYRAAKVLLNLGGAYGAKEKEYSAQ